MNWRESESRRGREDEYLVCELLLGAAYCSELLETEPYSQISVPESYQYRRRKKDELRAALNWFGNSDSFGEVSQQDLSAFRRIILLHYLGGMIEQGLDAKLTNWGNRLLRSLISSFGGH